MNKEILDSYTAAEKKELLKALQEEERREKENSRLAYERLRQEFVEDVFGKLTRIADDVATFKAYIDKEAEAFFGIMKQYGCLRKDDQINLTIISGEQKVEIRRNKVKVFDERADLAAGRLIEYLDRYVAGKENGSDDPMYQLCMTLLERNKQGKLDYKSISRLYELEGKFDAEYTDIMNLFRESNIITDTATNYYFFTRDEKGVWRRIEPSFCRL